MRAHAILSVYSLSPSVVPLCSYPTCRQASDVEWEKLITDMMEQKTSTLTELAKFRAQKNRSRAGSVLSVLMMPSKANSARVAPAPTESSSSGTSLTYKAFVKEALAAAEAIPPGQSLVAGPSPLDWTDADFEA